MSARKKPAKKAAAPKATKKVAAKAKAVKAPKKARITAKAIQAPKAVEAVMPNKAIAQKQTKSQIYGELADLAKVSKTDIKNVISAIRNVIERHVKPKGSGEITLPDLGIKVRRIQKKASKARMGRNPFTGEEIQIPAKPARKSVKVSALRTLKDLIAD
jgi:nucleoid DNA-binding protein